jgi:hypothetical protein
LVGVQKRDLKLGEIYPLCCALDDPFHDRGFHIAPDKHPDLVSHLRADTTASRAEARVGSAALGRCGVGVVYSNARRFSSSRREAMMERSLSASRRGLLKPVGRPNSVKVPAEFSENFLPKPIPDRPS